MSDEKLPITPPERTATPQVDERPSFNNPFNSSLPLLRVSLQEERPTYSLDYDDRDFQSPRFRSAAPSMTSRRSESSNPDLLQHGASSFATNRKLARVSTGTQTFRKPRPSTMLQADIPKPWLKYKDPAHRWAKWIFWGCWLAGIAVVVGCESFLSENLKSIRADFSVCYEAYASIPTLGNLCSVMEDDFSSGSINSNNWIYENRVDAGRLGTFQWATDSSNNSFVRDNILYLVPTITADHLGNDAIIDGHTVNLTTAGTCTSTNVSNCAISSNATLGTIINPVQGVTMRSKLSIRYGKVEIVARLPTG